MAMMSAMMVWPVVGRAQDSGVATAIGSLQGVLDQLYQDMLPLCSQLIGVGQAIAGFAALWYIAVRVWRHIGNAEPVDVVPLLRPFGIGMAIALFPFVIAVMNGVLQPTVAGTSQMLGNANAAISTLLTQKEDALKKTVPYQVYVGPNGSGNAVLWQLYSGNMTIDPLSQMGIPWQFELSKAFYNMKNSIKEWMSEILQIVYEAAALCINTMRTFQLLVLAILGPLVLGLSGFDGLHHSLQTWVARYINVFLWLPVANIFGAIIATIQTHMIQLDIQQIQSTGGTYFGGTDVAYLIFLIIGIVGYFTVPSVANYIVNVGGPGALSSKMTVIAGSVGARVAGAGWNIVRAPVDMVRGYIRSGRRRPNKDVKERKDKRI
jgi:conjugative transposon TraJ protein